MPWQTSEIREWNDMQRWIDGRTCGDDRFLFRGQPGKYNNLQPKLLRLLEQYQIRAYGDALQIETDLRHRFVRQAPLHLTEAPVRALDKTPSAEALLEWWGIMQHYGAPTRVLDWTGSPYVALYFAVEKDDTDGELWCYCQEELESRWSSAKQQKKLAGDPVSLSWRDYAVPLKVDNHPVLHHFIHSVQTSRMVAQQGVFTVATDVFCDHKTLLEEILGHSQNCCRAVIPQRLKSGFLERLYHMNITGAALFPGIDGVGRSVEEWGRIRMERARTTSEEEYRGRKPLPFSTVVRGTTSTCFIRHLNAADDDFEPPADIT